MNVNKQDEYVDFIIELEKLVAKYGPTELSVRMEYDYDSDSEEFCIYLNQGQYVKTTYSTAAEKKFLRNVVRDFDNRHNLGGEIWEWLY